MPRYSRYLAQAAMYGLFIAFIGYFSNSPAYQHLAPDQASIKLSLRHSGKLLGECRELSAEELAGLPATMRAPKSCPRERSPLLVELEINDEVVLRDNMEPRGLHDDGMASSYHRLTVPAGQIKLIIRMKDHRDQDVFPYQTERSLVLEPAQILVIDFDSQNGQFVFM